MGYVHKRIAWILVSVYVLFNFFLSYTPSQESAKISIRAMEWGYTLLPYWRFLLIGGIFFSIILFVIWQKQRLSPRHQKIKNLITFIVGTLVLGFGLYLSITYLLSNVVALNLNYWTLHLFFRKYGHLILYFLLGCIVKNALSVSHIRGIPAFLGALVICIFVAVSDEALQHFVPGRTSLLTDVAIDTLGAFIGISLYAFVESFCGERTVWQAFWNK